MNDKFTKVILTGILICLVFIALKPEEHHISTPDPVVQMGNNNRFIQIAPNIIGVVDTGSNTGKEQLVVFQFDNDSKTFNVLSTLDYVDVFTHPEQYGIK